MSGKRGWPREYWPLIGHDRSRDLNTCLSLVDTSAYMSTLRVILTQNFRLLVNRYRYKMSEDWLGCRVSLDCGSLGFFQGVISRIRLSDQVILASHWSTFLILSSHWSIFLTFSHHWCRQSLWRSLIRTDWSASSPRSPSTPPTSR